MHTDTPFSKFGNFFVICLKVVSKLFSSKNFGFEPGSLSEHAFLKIKFYNR